MMDKPPVNKVAQKNILLLDLEQWLPDPSEIEVFDLTPYLFQGLVVKEKEFRQAVKTTDWSKFQGKYVAISAPERALIPTWAWMLLSSNLEPHAAFVGHGSTNDLIEQVLVDKINNLTLDQYNDERVVIKGCGKYEISPRLYMKITSLLTQVAKSVAFGEPCSLVPVWKRT